MLYAPHSPVLANYHRLGTNKDLLKELSLFNAAVGETRMFWKLPWLQETERPLTSQGLGEGVPLLCIGPLGQIKEGGKHI